MAISGETSEQPWIHIIATGGTIAMTSGGDGAVQPRLEAKDLVAAVPQLETVGRITSETFSTVPSAHLQMCDVRDIALAASDALVRGCTGVVVAQGTDTLEETVFLIDLLLGGRLEAPVILTGAMRSSEQLGADGPANILASVQAAADISTRSQGALLCMNGELHAAHTVQKSHAFNLSAFVSPSTGPLGWIAEDRVQMHNRAHAGRRFDISVLPEDFRPVALHRVTLGDDAKLLDNLVGSKYRGLVVEGFGAGHVPPRFPRMLESIAAEMPVVVATRTGNGEVLRGTYGFHGSETDLWNRGMIPAGQLDGLKSRILLAVCVAVGLDTPDIVAAFESWNP